MGHWHFHKMRHQHHMGGWHFSPWMFMPIVFVFFAILTFKFWFPLLMIGLVVGSIAMCWRGWGKSEWREGWHKQGEVFKAQWKQWQKQWEDQSKHWKKQWSHWGHPTDADEDEDEYPQKRKQRPDVIRYHDLEPMPETLDEDEKPKRKRDEVDYI
ncbi:MAG: hypothetical protein OHK0023_12570 [Anaerolineae bacterium]